MNKEKKFMSVKERAYNIIDNLSEEQLKDFIAMFENLYSVSDKNRQAADEVDALCGIFHDAANPDLIPLEKTAWEQAAAENERAFRESYSNENT